MIENKLLRSLLTADIGVDVYASDSRKIYLVNAFTVWVLFFLLLFSVFHLYSGNYLIVAVNGVASVLAVYALIDLRRRQKIDRAATIIVLAMSIFLITFTVITQNRNYELVWTLFFPVFAFLLKGKKQGFYVTVAFYAILLPLVYLGIDVWQDGGWSEEAYLRFVASAMLMSILAYSFERSNDEVYERLRGIHKREQEQIVQLDNALKQQNKQQSLLQRQQRMAAMGEMLAMIAHQWRQPLSSITATTALLQIKVMTDQYEKAIFDSQLKNIGDYTQHLSKTIDDFRDFFKEDKECREFTFEELSEGALHIIGLSLQNRNIRLIKQYESKTKVSSYENELRQVVLNLLKNAEDVLVERGVKEPVITVRSYDDSIYTCLEVCDNGGGISAKIVEHLFEPYFTTKDTLNGTGLGLYMSKSIVEEHCLGSLNAVNENDGARFTIKLPKAVKSDL